MRYIIIDDERLARQRLERLLNKASQDLTQVGQAENGEEGARLINELKPDLVFLDIQMPVVTGFEMLSLLEHQPCIIFVTAFDDFAIKAFEESAVDYLLKPVREDRLEKALDKARRLTKDSVEQDASRILEYLKMLEEKPKSISQLTIHLGEKILFVPIDEIAYFHAEAKYVYVHTVDGKEHIVDESLVQLESKLPKSFLRVHRSHILNTDLIAEMNRSFNGRFVFKLKDKPGSKLSSGSSYSGAIRSALGI